MMAKVVYGTAAVAAVQTAKTIKRTREISPCNGSGGGRVNYVLIFRARPAPFPAQTHNLHPRPHRRVFVLGSRNVILSSGAFDKVLKKNLINIKCNTKIINDRSRCAQSTRGRLCGRKIGKIFNIQRLTISFCR